MFRMISRFLLCALLLQSSIVFGAPANHSSSLPSRSPRTLSKKVDTFLNKIREKVSSNTYTVKRLKGILEDAQKCKTPRDSIKIILSARKTYGADAQSNEYKQIWAALLVAIAKNLGSFAQKTLVNVLDELERRITFWEEQQARPTHYFLHKNPLRWFVGKGQNKEVKDNIKLVHKMQQEYLGHLGQLAEHMDSFNENANMQQQHAWVMKVLRIVHGIVCSNSKDKQALEEKELNKPVTNVMMTILSALPKHKQILEKKIYETQPPNHFARNWMWYTALTAGAIWAYRNKDGKVREWRTKLGDGASRFYETHLDGPWKEIKGMLGFGSTEQRTAQERRDDEERARQALLDRAERFYRDYHTNILEQPVVEEDLRRFRLALEENDTSRLDVIRAELSAVIRELPTDLGINLGQIVTNLDNILRNIARGRQPNNEGQNNQNNRSTFLQNRLLSERDRQILFESIDAINRFRNELGQNFVSNILGTNGQNEQVLNRLVSQRVLNKTLALLESYLITGDIYQVQLNHLLTRQKLNLILLTAIPTVGVAVGGYFGLRGLYRYIRPAYTFVPMKKALSEISRVLNWYEERPSNKMSTIDYGTLLYFVHKLKLDAKHIAKENIRHRFLRDVKEIELPQFTERQKMHVVTRMFREYDFLEA